jgi:hypothetical protein
MEDDRALWLVLRRTLVFVIRYGDKKFGTEPKGDHSS